jgi:hypothetical protein
LLMKLTRPFSKGNRDHRLKDDHIHTFDELLKALQYWLLIINNR